MLETHLHITDLLGVTHSQNANLHIFGVAARPENAEDGKRFTLRNREGEPMFGVVTTFKFKKPLTEEQIETIRDQAIKPMSQEAGFRHYFALSSETGDVVGFHAWDSREQAEAAIANLAPKLEPLLRDLLAEPPTRIMSEVVADYHA